MGVRVARMMEKQIQEAMVAFHVLVDQQGMEAVLDGDHTGSRPMPESAVGRL